MKNAKKLLIIKMYLCVKYRFQIAKIETKKILFTQIKYLI